MNKNLRELAKEHADNSVEYDEKKAVFPDRAAEIYRAIDSDIGSEDGLYYFSVDDKERYAHSSALMGVFSKMLGDDDRAEAIYRKINEKIGKRKWLYNLGFTDAGKRSTIKTTESNASMAILAKLLGKDDEAGKIYRRIGKMIGDSDGLYCVSTKEKRCDVEDNALMGIAAKLLGKDDDAKTLYEKIIERYEIEKNAGLYDSGWGPEAYENAAIAVFLELMGKKEDVDSISALLEHHMLKEGGLFSEDFVGRSPVTNSNALMGIYYCLKAGKKLS